MSWREAAADPRPGPLPGSRPGSTPARRCRTQALEDHPDIARQILALFRAEVRPGRPALTGRETRDPRRSCLRRHRSRLGVGRQPRRRPRAAPPAPWRCEAMMRTNYYQPDADGAQKPYICVQARHRRDRRTCRGRKPYCEIFVCSPPSRGRAPALRPGGAGRPAIDGPARRLPHRGAGAGQGAAVKNAVIVPVGAKGGFYPASSCRAAGAADVARGRGGVARQQDLPPPRAAGHHRQPRRRRRGPPAGRRDRPRRRRSLSGGGRRQGHGDLLRHRQRRGRGLRLLARRRLRAPAARWATTTRPWASPPAAPGRRCKRHFRELGKDIQTEPFTAHRRRRHVRRRVRQRHAAGRKRSSWSPPSTTATFFLDPDPDPGQLDAERSAPVRPAALVLGRLRQEPDLQGRRGLPAHAKSIDAERRGPGPPRRDRRRPGPRPT